jgi:hypothetical protein
VTSRGKLLLMGTLSVVAAGCGGGGGGAKTSAPLATCQDVANDDAACAATLGYGPVTTVPECQSWSCSDEQKLLDCLVGIQCSTIASVNDQIAACFSGAGCSGSAIAVTPLFTAQMVTGKTIQFAQATSYDGSTWELDSYGFRADGTVLISSTVLPSSGTWRIESDGSLTIAYGASWRRYTLAEDHGTYFVVDTVHSDGATASGIHWVFVVPFTTSMVAGHSITYTGSAGPILYIFNGDGTVAIVSSGTWIAYGWWTIELDGSLTIASGGSSVSFSLVQSGGASVAVNYTNGATAVLNADAQLGGPNPVSDKFFGAMVSGASLQVHYTGGDTLLYSFHADGTVTLAPSWTSSFDGTWAVLSDGTLRVTVGGYWMSYALLQSYGTFLLVDETDSDGSTASRITLTYPGTGAGFDAAMLSGYTLTGPDDAGGTVSITFNADGTASLVGGSWPGSAAWVVNADGTLTINFGAGPGWIRLVPAEDGGTYLVVNEVARSGAILVDLVYTYDLGGSSGGTWTPQPIGGWTPPVTGPGYVPPGGG